MGIIYHRFPNMCVLAMNVTWNSVYSLTTFGVLYYQHYQLGTGGHAQKAQPVQGVYIKHR